jgi:glycosyltransferase involved in cell wall biosynthesis
MSISVTFPGDANLVSTFGGAPYYLLQALRRHDPAATGLALVPRNLRLRRYAWNLREQLFLRGSRGYQYSDLYLDDLWRGEPRDIADRVVVNLGPLYGVDYFHKSRSKKTFFIDQTLTQLHVGYLPKFLPTSARHRRDSIEKEKRQFAACDLVMCMCQCAANSVVSDYGIDPDKVVVILPGGNIDADAYARFEQQRLATVPLDALCSDRAPLKFVFIGMEPDRKGLFRFLDAIDRVPDVAKRLRLTVIGPSGDSIPKKYRGRPEIDWLGRIDKTKEIARFIDTVANHDVGILLSTAEATGLSLREFQMLGLAVLAPDVGGSPEMLVHGAADLVSRTDGPEQIAHIILDLLNNPDRVAKMKRAAWASRREMTWERTASNMLAVLRSRGLTY